jgi:hypothetical protein
MNGHGRKLSRGAFKAWRGEGRRAGCVSKATQPALPVCDAGRVTGSFALIKPSADKKMVSDPVVSCEAQKLPRWKVRRRGCAMGPQGAICHRLRHQCILGRRQMSRERLSVSLGAHGISARRRTLINHGANGRPEKLAKATPNSIAKCSSCVSTSSQQNLNSSKLQRFFSIFDYLIKLRHGLISIGYLFL